MFFYLRIYTGVLLFLMFFISGVFPMGSKEKIPMKPYNIIKIPKGEFLHYVSYTGGEKDSDTYMVTTMENGKNGNSFYRIYLEQISLSRAKKPPKSYTEWPSFTDIDPLRGSVMEWEETYVTNATVFRNNESAFYPYYFHYKYFPEKDYVDEFIKSIKGNQTREAKYHIKVNHNFPIWDQISFGFYSIRFLDAQKGGIAYMIAPFMLKDPAPVAFKYISSETIKTKAGSFRANKINIIIADAFIGKLMEPMMKTTALWIEDSDRRLLLKVQLFGNETVLEEISNVNVK